MQQAVPVGTGTMAAILGLDDEQVQAACSEAAAPGEVVEAVNFNAPSQVVIAGHVAAVERACQAARARGAKRAVALAVSAPFHSSLLRPASDALRERLAGERLATPRVPVINNVDVAIESDPDRIRDALARQAARPVRWVETIRRMASEGVTDVVECGPGKVLSGLTRRIAPDLASHAVFDAASLDQALERLGH
jgi:[acyl-carrier-protein] S-malonyltransferase